MFLSVRGVVVGAVMALLTACGGPLQEGGSGRGHDSQDALNAGAGGAPRTPGDDNGTELTGTSAVTEVTCTGGHEARVTVAGTVSTTGSVDSVEVTSSLDGAPAQRVITLSPQDFEHDGRNKTAAYAFQLAVPGGEHTLEVCFIQSGSQGREPKRTCAPVLVLEVDCAPTPGTCADREPFGNLVGNPSLCKGKGPPHIPVHVRGDFGEAPDLTITGPGGFSYAAAMRHAGESCNYHYNWDAASNGGAGTYTFTVTGSGHTLSFTAELHCQGRRE